MDRIIDSTSKPDHSPDQVYPVHLIDQAAVIRSSIINYVFRYDCVLDADKLHRALSQLIEVGEWRKLGGRLRRNVRPIRCTLETVTKLTSRAEKWSARDTCAATLHYSSPSNTILSRGLSIRHRFSPESYQTATRDGIKAQHSRWVSQLSLFCTSAYPA